MLAIAPVIGSHHSIVPLCIIWPENLTLLAHPRLRLVPWHLYPTLCIHHALQLLLTVYVDIVQAARLLHKGTKAQTTCRHTQTHNLLRVMEAC